jgi:hypothetical protein
VEPDGASPVAVQWRGCWHRVASIEDDWRIDDEWWTAEEISRHYCTLLLAELLGRVAPARHAQPVSSVDTIGRLLFTFLSWIWPRNYVVIAAWFWDGT